MGNAQFQGPAGAMTYRFEIATSGAFSPVVVTSPAVIEGSRQTSFTSTTDLTSNQTYFWRAAFDVSYMSHSPAFLSTTSPSWHGTRELIAVNPPYVCVACAFSASWER